jgi:hypothetical protein
MQNAKCKMQTTHRAMPWCVCRIDMRMLIAVKHGLHFEF